MNMLKYGESRTMLAKQLEWFVRSIAVSAWRWRKPLFPSLIETQRAAEEQTLILAEAMIYGVLAPAFVDPVEIDFIAIFDAFFADPALPEKDSLHLAEVLAEAIGKALEL